MGLFDSIRGIFGGRVEKAATKLSGSDGVSSYGGYLADGEASAAMRGPKKWTTYTNAINAGIVATGVRYFGNLLAGTEWHVEPNPLGGKDAERAAELVRLGLIEADMPKPWPAIVRKAAMYRLYGFSLHEWKLRRRHDGSWGFAELQHRPQYTVDRWDKPDEMSPVRGIWQRTRSGKEYAVDIEQCLYCVDDTLTDNPDGVGLLRHVIELVRRLERYQDLEGLAYESDMGGTPIGRAPLSELAANAGSDDAAKIQEHIDRKTSNMRQILSKRIKTPEQLQWLLLDSAPFTGLDKSQISGVQKWAFEILKGETNGLPDINVVIGRLQFEIARVLGVEFALVGSEGGSYSLHEDKTSMFATNLQVTLAEMGNFATSQLARKLVKYNGLDPETCTPRCVAEPISTDAIETVTRALANLSVAGLAPDDPARNVIRKRLRLPPEPEMTPEMMGALGRRTFGEPPDPEKDEVDVELEDLDEGEDPKGTV
ncbi:MAG: hypothetical protein H0U12_07185 [Thermoleophilaceae bacterium]|nr:hypothetical protein [Thermoleophilaceae bacterium]